MAGKLPLYGVNILDERLPSKEAQRIYAQEMAKLAGSAAIVAAMERGGVSRKDLAERIERTPSFVSQVLNGTRNMTLETFADLAWAVGLQVNGFELGPLGEASVPAEFVNAWLDETFDSFASEFTETFASAERDKAPVPDECEPLRWAA